MQDLRQSEIGVPGPSQLRRRKRHAAAVAGNELSVWLVAEMERDPLRRTQGSTAPMRWRIRNRRAELDVPVVARHFLPFPPVLQNNEGDGESEREKRSAANDPC